MVIRGEAKANTLEHIYDICNRLFKDKNCFYTQEELEQARTNESNIFLEKDSKAPHVGINACKGELYGENRRQNQNPTYGRRAAV